jgi:Phosphotransferase enzyme family
MASAREDKPAWRAVPESVKSGVEQVLGARVVIGRRRYGGYGPSATFELGLDDGTRAFFKGTYPAPEGVGVAWNLEQEIRVYERIGAVISPWAPAYLGSFSVDGWQVLLLEALSGETMPPWTTGKARRTARSYAQFHASTMMLSLPRWLSRNEHREMAGEWHAIADSPDQLSALAALAGDQREVAGRWLEANVGTLRATEARLATARPPHALLHLDTRSDNIRLQGQQLRIFDWPYACVGPAELDLAELAQSIELEGGQPAEATVAWYSEVLPVRRPVLHASIVALAGFFAARAPRADIPGLPRLRSFQRRQLKTTLGWAVRELGLPAPAWLAAIRD